SSILEALKKVEAVERRPLDLPASPSLPPRGRRIGSFLAIAFAAGVGLAFWLRPAAHESSTPEKAPTPPPARAPATPPAAPPPTAPAPPGAVHASPGETVLSRPPAGAPRVQLSFLVFSQTPERRSVVLAIDGGSLVTLHEGETAAGLEVARILPDRVHLRMGGQ